MTIHSEEVIQLDWQQAHNRTLRVRQPKSRSPGMHVMTVVHALAKAAGKLDEWDRPANGSYPHIMAVGDMFEEWRASCYGPELIWQPPEGCRDGIYGNWDGDLSFFLGVNKIERADWEAKATTAKMKSIADCWIYLKQDLSYAAIHGMRWFCQEILWLKGDYSMPHQPLITRSIFSFEQHEVESWWDIMKRTAREMEAQHV